MNSDSMKAEKFFIEEMPIFSAGVRDGVYYSLDDIDAIVANHQLTSKRWMPAAGLGHYGDGASLIDDSDGPRTRAQISFRQIPLVWPNLHKLGCTGTAEPAVGWITKLWRKGTTLWAAVQDIPAIVAQMIKDKMFRFVSAEIYQTPPNGVGGEGCFLHGIGFLGKTPPEVKTLGEAPEPQPQAFAGQGEGKHGSRRVPFSIVVPFPERVHVFSETSAMDSKTSWRKTGVSQAAAAVLDALPPLDRVKIKKALFPVASFAEGGVKPDTPPQTANVYQTIALQKAYTAGEIERGAAIETAVSVGKLSRETAERLFPLVKPTVLAPDNTPAVPTQSTQQKAPAQQQAHANPPAINNEVNMDLNQLATEAGFNQDIVRVLGTLPHGDQDAIASALEAARQANANSATEDEEGALSLKEIGNTLKFSRDVVEVLNTIPPAESIVIRKALEMYIADNGAPVAFSASGRPTGMSAERRRELLGHTSVGQAILASEQKGKKPAIAFSASRKATGMTIARRRELLSHTAIGSAILSSEKKNGL